MALKLIHGSKKLAGHSIAVFADLFSKSSYAFWEKVVSFLEKARDLCRKEFRWKTAGVLDKRFENPEKC